MKHIHIGTSCFNSDFWHQQNLFAHPNSTPQSYTNMHHMNVYFKFLSKFLLMDLCIIFYYLYIQLNHRFLSIKSSFFKYRWENWKVDVTMLETNCIYQVHKLYNNTVEIRCRYVFLWCLRICDISTYMQF